MLATDYFQYALGWGCEDISATQSREFAWVISRTPELPDTYRERVNNYIDQFLDTSFIRDTNQTACDHGGFAHPEKYDGVLIGNH